MLGCLWEEILRPRHQQKHVARTLVSEQRQPLSWLRLCSGRGFRGARPRARLADGDSTEGEQGAQRARSMGPPHGATPARGSRDKLVADFSKRRKLTSGARVTAQSLGSPRGQLAGASAGLTGSECRLEQNLRGREEAAPLSPSPAFALPSVPASFRAPGGPSRRGPRARAEPPGHGARAKAQQERPCAPCPPPPARRGDATGLGAPRPDRGHLSACPAPYLYRLKSRRSAGENGFNPS